MIYAALGVAIVLEVVATSLLKATQGFTRPGVTVLCVACYIASIGLVSQVVKSMPVGIAYAIWAGLGTTLVVLIGFVFLKQHLGAVTLLGVILIIGGVVLVNVSAHS